jgi:serine/threonine-protein kinase
VSEARAAVRTLLLCDLVASTRLVERIGDAAAAELLAQHDRAARELLHKHDGREIDKSDGFLFLFERPIEAVRFALAYQRRVAELAGAARAPLSGRVGIHLGEVILRENAPEAVARGAKLLEVEGLAKAIAARVMSLAAGGRILLSRAAFDVARRSTVGDSSDGGALRWVAHGLYRFAGVDEPMEVFEVAPAGTGELLPPADSEKCRRVDDSATIVGWRPAPGIEVPGRSNWILSRRIGEGGFGEVWLATQRKTREPRVFKFCYDAKSLSSLRREISLFRLLKEALGERRDITRIIDWNLETAPYFIESEYTPGGNVREWIEERGGFGAVPLTTRLEIAAQVAEALAAAHSVGVLHKDLKPANVLIAAGPDGSPRAQLTDFGIGVLLDRSNLAAAGITFRTELVDSEGSSSTGGTLGYLAPEILEGRPATLQADIYALGVLLYQLAIGDFSHLIAPGWEDDIEDELLRSDIAAMIDGRAQRRPANAQRIAERLRTLEARRAEIASEQRARAEAEETKRRLERSLRRRKIWIGAAAALSAVALVTGFQAWRIAQEADRANRAAKTEERVSGLLVRLFETSDPAEARGAEISAREVLERGAKRLEGELASEPSILSRLLGVVGRVYQNLGDYPRSEDLLRKAVKLGAGLPELSRAEVEHDLANTYWYQGRFAEAEPIYQRVIATRTGVLGADAPATLLAKADLASLYFRTSRHAECEALAEEILLAVDRIDTAERAPDDALENARSVAEEVLFHLFIAEKRLDEAEAIQQKMLARDESRLGADHPVVIISRINLASLLVDRGRFHEAEGAFREVAQDAERVLGRVHPDTLGAQSWLACSMLAQHKRTEAARLVHDLVQRGFSLRPDSAEVCAGVFRTDPLIWKELTRTAAARVESTPAPGGGSAP